jgi:hypothetical protein
MNLIDIQPQQGIIVLFSSSSRHSPCDTDQSIAWPKIEAVHNPIFRSRL